jgi:rare lipoprotein A
VILLRCLALLMVLAGCTVSAPPPSLHYELGKPYQSGGVWYYPRENLTYDDTGLAFVIEEAPAATTGKWWMGVARSVAGAPPRLTADGELFDEGALAAAHPTLQLPAIARITNLENGRQVVVRINDRAPSSPDRVIAITSRTAQLLAAADPAAIRVRVQVLEGESRQVLADLTPADAKLAVAAAPAGSVQAESLAPPSGAAQGAGAIAQASPKAQSGADPPASAPPTRLPEVVTAVPVRPTALAVDCGDFSQAQFAAMLQARVAALGARVTTSYDAPRESAFIVRIGPLPNTAAAEAMRRRAVAAGAIDARIVVQYE